MKRAINIIITLVLFASGSLAADQDHTQWVKTLPKPWLVQPQELTKILPEFQQRFPDYHQRLKAIALWRLGTPYKIFNLGEEAEPDLDPIFRLDVSDCTSHVLTSISLAQSDSWQSARDNLVQLHYKPDDFGNIKPDYKKRWHYTSDRLLHNSITPEITSRFVTPEQLQTVTVTLNQKQDGSEFLPLDWTRQVSVRYIPSNEISGKLLDKLPGFIGVAFVKKSYFKMGIITAHEGMLLDGKYLLHAGQSAKETVKEDFLNYYFTSDGPKFDGVMLYEFKPIIDNPQI